MPIPKKWIPVLSFFLVVYILRVTKRVCWNFIIPAYEPSPLNVETTPRLGIQPRRYRNDQKPLLEVAGTNFQNGTLKAVGGTYTKMIVIPKTKEEDVSWVHENFGNDKYINSAIYSVDDTSAKLHPPKNKGHEVMVYLSYIVDHYDELADVNIFMHSHRIAWHNDELLEHDAVEMVSRLSAERVQRVGYKNLRCHWEPGCPAWEHPGAIEEDINKKEEVVLAKVWPELFPYDPIPSVLSQPCCAQFAISRDRIRSLPLSRYVFYRDWLLRTQLSDYISGRVWEYIWQFVFTGQEVLCPSEHVCYCDGFGVCFGGEEEYAAYWKRNTERVALEEELNSWKKNTEQIEQLRREGKNDEAALIEEPKFGRDVELEGRIARVLAWCKKRRQKAKAHGDLAMNRALEAGREWRDGDGF